MKRPLSITIVLAILFCGRVTALAAMGATTLDEARVTGIVQEYLQKKTGLTDGSIHIKKLGFSGVVVLPAGKPSFEVISPQEWEGWGRGALALIVRIDDHVVKNIPMNVEVETLAYVVVATRELERGMIVAKDDVALEKRDMASVAAKSCRNLEEVVGKRVRVGIRASNTLRSDYLERLPLVKSGQMVTIVAENDQFRITASGRARGNGAEGDTVMVQCLNAQKEIPAVVVNAHTVRVEF